MGVYALITPWNFTGSSAVGRDKYGLAACVWTDDLSTAHRLAAQIHAGTVYVNMLPFLDPAAVHGGFGASGSGREFGPAGIEEFTETKGVRIGL